MAKRIDEEEKEKEKHMALIKSSNPHLAGGESYHKSNSVILDDVRHLHHHTSPVERA